MIRFKNNEYKCATEVTLALISGKWKPLILWHVSRKTLRFNEIRRLEPNATQKMLTQQLREMEYDGLLIRKTYDEVPPKVEYSLSDFGKSLIPILDLMSKWGHNYLSSLDQNKT